MGSFYNTNTNSFNISVHNDKITNVTETIAYIFGCISADKNTYLFIDESPDLACLQVGEENFLTFLHTICDQFKYPRERISIEIENLVQSNCWPNLKRSYISVDVLYAQKIDFQCDKELKYKTSLFVGGSRWPRLSLASYLYGKYKNDSLITYWQNLKDTTQSCHLHLDDLFKHHMPKGVDEKLIDQIQNFLKALPLHLQDSDRQSNKNIGFINYTEAYNLAPLYNNVFCDVVCETVHNGQTFAFTEKSARCWMTKTPFMVFGPRNYLKNLRRLGFKTFDLFWNENYDRHDNVSRILMMQEQIDRIHKMDYKQLEKLYNSAEMQDVVENNYQVFKNLSRQKIKKVFGITDN